MNARVPVPGLDLRPYQLAILLCASRFIAWIASRRIGKSFAVSLRSVMRALGALGNRPQDQHVFAPGLTQSVRFLSECKMHLRALEAASGMRLIVQESATRIVLSNGRTFYALPNNVATIRGYGGDVIFEEAGVIPNAKKLHDAASPIADATLKNRQGGTIIYNGTGLGDDSWFHDIIETDEGKHYATFRTTYEQALRQGHVGDPLEVMKERCTSEEQWETEYNCGWAHSGAVYFSTELLDSVCYHDPDMEIPKGLKLQRSKLPKRPPIQHAGAGMDIARWRHLSAVQELGRSSDARLWDTRSDTAHRMPFVEQEQWVGKVLTRHPLIHIDQGGMGEPFVERLQDEYGAGRVVGVKFTNERKANLMGGIKLGLERKTLLLRADNIELRRSLGTIRRHITAASNIRFDADESSDTGHGDLAYALGLAVEAAGGCAKKPLSGSPVYAGPRTKPANPLDVSRKDRGRKRRPTDGI